MILLLDTSMCIYMDGTIDDSKFDHSLENAYRYTKLYSFSILFAP